jgi:hypothetical protein
MRYAITVLAAVLALQGCISVPIAAKSSKGEKFLGSATATPFSGTFHASSLNGVRCWGTYNPWDYSPDLPVKFQLSDGRVGQAIIVRDLSGISGMGVGKTSDGEKFDFWMGLSINDQVRSQW